MSITPSGATARSAWPAHGPDSLKERDVVADAECGLMRHGEREGLGQLAYRLHVAILAIFLRQDVLLRGPAAGLGVPEVCR